VPVLLIVPRPGSMPRPQRLRETVRLLERQFGRQRLRNCVLTTDDPTVLAPPAGVVGPIAASISFLGRGTTRASSAREALAVDAAPVVSSGPKMGTSSVSSVPTCTTSIPIPGVDFA